MGKMEDGVFSGFRGRVGNLVGAKRYGEYYLRIAPSTVRNPKTEGQETQRGKFALAVNFVRRILPYVRVSYRDDNLKRTAYSSAVSCVTKYGIDGKAPDCTLNYANVFVSRGELAGAQDEAVQVSEGKVLFTWTDNSGTADARSSDVAMPLVYNVSKQQAVWDTDGAKRKAQVTELALPASWDAKECVAYLGFRSASGDAVANSVYFDYLCGE